MDVSQYSIQKGQQSMRFT